MIELTRKRRRYGARIMCGAWIVRKKPLPRRPHTGARLGARIRRTLSRLGFAVNVQTPGSHPRGFLANRVDAALKPAVTAHAALSPRRPSALAIGVAGDVLVARLNLLGTVGNLTHAAAVERRRFHREAASSSHSQKTHFKSRLLQTRVFHLSHQPATDLSDLFKKKKSNVHNSSQCEASSGRATLAVG